MRETINYNYILPNLIVGSCVQSPEDVDILRNIGVKTVICLQQDADLENCGVDIKAIQHYAQTVADIEHIRAEINDLEGYDLRMRLPEVVGTMYKAVNRNGGVCYLHCTAGLGRSPAVALAYMYWVHGLELNEAHGLLLSKRSCCPNMNAVKSATADILAKPSKKRVAFKWEDPNCSYVEISGLDIGWGRLRIRMEFDKEENVWVLERELPEGRNEYMYVVDEERLLNEHEPVTPPNDCGQVFNYIEVVSDDPNSYAAQMRARLTRDDPHLTSDERLAIRQFLDKVGEDKS